LYRRKAAVEKKKIAEILVDRLVLKTMAEESPEARIIGGKAAFPTRCRQRVPPRNICDKLPA
jgi:hypothetical protein